MVNYIREVKSMHNKSDKPKRRYFREIDELGRVVPPAPFRKKLHIKPGDELEFWLDGETIVMKKVENSCSLCGKTGDLILFKEGFLCKNCQKELKNY